MHIWATKRVVVFSPESQRFWSGSDPEQTYRFREAFWRNRAILIDELLVIGGVLWGTDTSNDYFVQSHGIATPDAFWKVIVRQGRVIAWIIPNSESAKFKVLDNYLVSVRKIEQLTGEKIPVEEFLKDELPNSSWQIPMGCDRG